MVRAGDEGVDWAESGEVGRWEAAQKLCPEDSERTTGETRALS